MKNILVINGVNLNLLGRREPLLYGTQSFDNYVEGLRAEFPDVQIEYAQYSDEAGIINHLHRAFEGGECHGVVINPAAYTHTSIALADAVAALCGGGIKVIEVHISNIYARELFRHHSYVSKVASGTISGLGLDGYRLAISALLKS